MNLTKRTLTYKVVGNCHLLADVYQIPNEALQPGILWLHGGALIFGDRSLLPYAQATRYLQAGYTVVAADYRLAPETKIGLILEDVRDAYDWMRLKGPGLLGIASEYIAVVGHSAGGYLALMAGLRLYPRPRALVSFYGYSDIAGDWYNQPDPFYGQQPAVPRDEAYQVVGGSEISGSPINERFRFYLYCRQQGLWTREVVGDESDRAPLCPIHNITRDYPPTLLLHGEQDNDVPCQQSVSMAGELARQGVEHELVVLSGYGHAFDTGEEGIQDPNVAPAFESVLRFLSRYMNTAPITGPGKRRH
jgi:acetyl esterase/lipase